MNKAQIRTYISEKKKQMTPEQIQQLSAQLQEKFLQLPQYREASCLYAYNSYNQEVRTAGIIEQAVRDGKRVAVPRVISDTLEFRYIYAREQCSPGMKGILEPGCDLVLADDKEQEVLMLIPGLAFSKEGARVGYGKGMYDRYLAAHPQIHFTIVALCYDFQVVDDLQPEPHDRPIDILLTAPQAGQ